MNGFHVQAVGWVLTFNAFALNRQEAQELSGLWAALLRARAEDKSTTHPLFRLLMPRSIPLSGMSLGAFADLVDRMAALHPERFSCGALRRRRNHWALQVAVGLLLAFLAAITLPMASPGGGAVVSMLFMLGCSFLVPTVTLWRAASVAKCFSLMQQARCTPPQKISRRSASHERGTPRRLP